MKTLKKTLMQAFILAVVICCFSCTSNNEKETAKWIEKAQKPIVCKFYGINGMGQVSYTLISNDCKIYSTGLVEMSLPDTIK